jgi:hypothetical protein
MATRKTPSLMKLANAEAKETAEHMRWQAEDDLRTLQRAKEIEANRTRLAAAKKIAVSQIKQLEKIKGK